MIRNWSKIFVLSAVAAVVAGFGFGVSEGFVSHVRPDGTFGLCSEGQSSAPDDNATPLFAVLLLAPAAYRLLRFSTKMNALELAVLAVALGLESTLVVFTRNCADFSGTLFVSKNWWFWAFLVSHATLVLSVVALRWPTRRTA